MWRATALTGPKSTPACVLMSPALCKPRSCQKLILSALGGTAGNLSCCVCDYGSVNLNRNEEKTVFCTHCRCLGGSKIQPRDEVFVSLWSQQRNVCTEDGDDDSKMGSRGQGMRCNNPKDREELRWWLARTLYNHRGGRGGRKKDINTYLGLKWVEHC